MSNIDTERASTSSLKAQVRRFYELLWNAHDLTLMSTILHEDFTFRGSLGEEKQGYEGFAEYVGMVHTALGEYRCNIGVLVEEGDRVFAKMSFEGIHKGRFMGFEPTSERVHWDGCALFTFRGKKVSDLWVLGDVKGLEERLRRNLAQRAATRKSCR